MASLNPRIRTRLTPHNYDRLTVAVKRGSRSQAEIINRALTRYFREDENNARDAAILRRLDLMTRHDHRHTRDLNLALETISLFVHYFFTVMPEVSQVDQEARAALGVSHFNGFLDELTARMRGGGKTIKNALEDVLVTDTDFFTAEEIERLKSFDQVPKIPAKAKNPKPAKAEANHVPA